MPHDCLALAFIYNNRFGAKFMFVKIVTTGCKTHTVTNGVIKYTQLWHLTTLFYQVHLWRLFYAPVSNIKILRYMREIGTDTMVKISFIFHNI